MRQHAAGHQSSGKKGMRLTVGALRIRVDVKDRVQRHLESLQVGVVLVKNMQKQRKESIAKQREDAETKA